MILHRVKISSLLLKLKNRLYADASIKKRHSGEHIAAAYRLQHQTFINWNSLIMVTRHKVLLVAGAIVSVSGITTSHLAIHKNIYSTERAHITSVVVGKSDGGCTDPDRPRLMG